MKKGDIGQKVKDLQMKINKVMGYNMAIDGHYGKSTERCVTYFQNWCALKGDGIAGRKTLKRLDYYYAKATEKSKLLADFPKEFVVFVDAGHWGVDDKGRYADGGKKAFHLGCDLHEGGWYYEGHENRIIAEKFIRKLTAEGITAIRTYHPYKEVKLSYRTNTIRSWLRRGCYGYMHSIHSNAISSSNSAIKLENTRGFMTFNTVGDTFSDEIASQHFLHMRGQLKDKMLFRTQEKDGDVDFEANFSMLRDTDLREFKMFGAILDEFDFHTSAAGCRFIMEHRFERVEAMFETAKWVKKELQKI